mmetsp:Transcript_46305/g.149105  ORF Transcript_46305/g.149105 Transcript_46305/m.149105 type:complete len:202 (-) Transcript_46305:171-776(-)
MSAPPHATRRSSSLRSASWTSTSLARRRHLPTMSFAPSRSSRASPRSTRRRSGTASRRAPATLSLDCSSSSLASPRPSRESWSSTLSARCCCCSVRRTRARSRRSEARWCSFWRRRPAPTNPPRPSVSPASRTRAGSRRLRVGARQPAAAARCGEGCCSWRRRCTRTRRSSSATGVPPSGPPSTPSSRPPPPRQTRRRRGR